MRMTRKQDKTYVDVPLERLKPHPRNAVLYKSRTPTEIEDLAADMAANGQTEAVEVTPAMIIISGHARWEAAKKLGWKTLRCWVRADLAEAGPEAVEARVIEANLYRRQLTRLDLVRSYRELKRLTKNRWGQSRSEGQVKGDLRDVIARRFSPPVSGRTLDRWLQLLDLPMSIQEAVDAGSLKLTEAVKVAALEADAQAQVAKEISKGVPIKEVLAHRLYRTPTEELTASKALERLLRALVRAQEELGDRVEEIRRIGFSSELEQLRDGKHLINEIIAKIKRNQAQGPASPP
jgi:ParB-like chromosome segregation protein Spo0J